MYYQTVELEHNGEVKLQCNIERYEEGDIITNVEFAEDYVQLFGVEVSIKSLPSELVRAIFNEVEQWADDMKWEE